jgi:pyruvate dehydrogenase E1 component alpha subunit
MSENTRKKSTSKTKKIGDPLKAFQILSEDGKILKKRPASLTDDDLVSLYQKMRFQRLVDDRMLTLQRQGRISFYGACTGQEAAVIGSGFAIQEQDWVFPALREGGIALMRGLSFDHYVAQLFGNGLDPGLGRQMPCHYSSRAANYVSLSSPIGNQIPQAVGAAMASQIQKTSDVVVGYMGDGATSEGDFHVAMNFAGLYQLPIVLFCQNNQWAISLPSSKQTASKSIAIKAKSYGFEGVLVDGNDALAVYEITRKAIEKARSGGGPTFIEALTYRIGAHSSSDDPSRYRDESITEQWRERCPINRLLQTLIQLKLWSNEEEERFAEETIVKIKETVARIELAPAPAIETLFSDVYATMPRHLEEQQEELLASLYAQEKNAV